MDDPPASSTTWPVFRSLGGSRPALTDVRLLVRGPEFTAFHERCPVLRVEAEVRESRLALCDLTARVLGRGLGLLGIGAPDRTWKAGVSIAG
jgi:hypothetical protein